MNDKLEKLSDTQAEAGIIATLVYHPEFILHSDCLKAGYFYHKDNGCIYWAIDQLFKSGVENIDAFLNVNKDDVHDPLLMKNMKEGVELLHSVLGLDEPRIRIIKDP